jgi:hypothetical protein
LTTIAEDPAARESRLRRRNRTTLVWLGAILLGLMVLGYQFGHWLMKHPPTSAH